MKRLGCDGCGAAIPVEEGASTVVCRYCGCNQRVEKFGAVMSLRKIELGLAGIQQGTDRTAAELALVRLARELEELESRRSAALGAYEIVRGGEIARRYGNRAAAIWISFFTAIIVVYILSSSFSWIAAIILWIFIYVIMALWIDRKTLPPDASADLRARFDAEIAIIEKKIQANRAIVD